MSKLTLTISQIPSYLIGSNFYNVLTEDDDQLTEEERQYKYHNETFQVNQTKFKLDDFINSPEDFVLLFTTCSYWGCPFPQSFFDYMVSNKYDALKGILSLDYKQDDTEVKYIINEIMNPLKIIYKNLNKYDTLHMFIIDIISLNCNISLEYSVSGSFSYEDAMKFANDILNYQPDTLLYFNFDSKVKEHEFEFEDNEFEFEDNYIDNGDNDLNEYFYDLYFKNGILFFGNKDPRVQEYRNVGCKLKIDDYKLLSKELKNIFYQIKNQEDV